MIVESAELSVHARDTTFAGGYPGKGMQVPADNYQHALFSNSIIMSASRTIRTYKFFCSFDINAQWDVRRAFTEEWNCTPVHGPRRLSGMRAPDAPHPPTPLRPGPPDALICVKER
jgi:hypothetical protein